MKVFSAILLTLGSVVLSTIAAPASDAEADYLSKRSYVKRGIAVGSNSMSVASVSPSKRADGTFFYTRADTGRETFLGATPNG
ncbi:hypothetical protein BG015_005492, partial [Linnemannia schmuckeri]